MATFFKNCRRLISRACSKCMRWFCIDCLTKREMNCRSCDVLVIWPVQRPQLLELKARDIKAFLTANGVSTHGCVEKEELVELAFRYLNNRHQNPSCSTRRVSTHVVDDTWVMVNDITNSPTQDTTSSNSHAAADTATDPNNGSMPEENDSHPRSPPISIPQRLRVQESTSPLSTSLPPLSSMNDNVNQDNDQVASLNLSSSESCINLSQEMSQADTVTAGTSSSSQLNGVNSIVSMSRTDITTMSDEELEKLTVKHLKWVLAANRVDFRGCCEKDELLERARRLRQQLQSQAKIDVDELSHDSLCKVCMAAPIDCVLLDCGHLVACTPCGKQMNECPICRQYVIRVVKTFRA